MDSGQYVIALKAAIPKSCHRFLSTDLIDMIDQIEQNPYVAEGIKRNVLSYASVLQDSAKIDLQHYIRMCMYASYKLSGDTALTCYAKTYPDRYANLVSRGVTAEVIAKYAQGVERSQMFVRIMEQAIVPAWILNQDKIQKAINVLVEIAEDKDKSAVARVQAANALLVQLSKPEKVINNINIQQNNINNESSALDDLKQAMKELANNQQQRIINGEATKVIAGEVICANVES